MRKINLLILSILTINFSVFGSEHMEKVIQDIEKLSISKNEKPDLQNYIWGHRLLSDGYSIRVKLSRDSCPDFFKKMVENLISQNSIDLNNIEYEMTEEEKILILKKVPEVYYTESYWPDREDTLMYFSLHSYLKEFWGIPLTTRHNLKII